VDAGLDDLAMHRVIAFILLWPRAARRTPTSARSHGGIAVRHLDRVPAAVRRGVLRARHLALWRKAGVGRGIRRLEPVSFALGWAALAIALLSSIDTLAEHSFAVHMVQHELLMVVRGAADRARASARSVRWGLPPPCEGAAAAVARTPVIQALWQPDHLFAGGVEHSCAGPVDLARADPVRARVDALRVAWSPAHLLLRFRAGLLVVRVRARITDLRAWAIASLFTTMLHTSALGALLTFAPSAWYLLDGPPAFGLTALEDQQLGGLVMWVPGGLAYMIAGLAVVRRWLSLPCIAASATRPQSDREADRHRTSPITRPAQNP
jgi:hypothetical protein